MAEPAPPFRILLVEDNPADADLARETLLAGRFQVDPDVAEDGVIALERLRRHGAPLPDLIILDLNLPRIDGRQVLTEIKRTDSLKMIPVVVLTSSEEERDIESSYALGANCYIAKPKNLRSFKAAFRALEEFWFSIAKLPAAGRG